ncbi:hypothetical protein [Stenotrophomonas sp.]|uniref:hypothetical protein n=1 Tax=Stenotrophomonas sp. TaxID=69392 RepID=UPI0028ADDE4F|nr:hypothetical protein [Stenotrophomonas sp.]
MESLFSKIGNLGYELLGIFLPGFIFIHFMVFWWWSIGPMAGIWSQEFIPQAQVVQISGFIEVLNEGVQVGVLLFLALASYFIGHALHWISRGGPKRGELNFWSRVGYSVIFRVPKPDRDYHAGLDGVFEEAKIHLGFGSDSVWREYYPIAKSYLAKNLQTSLSPVYQNKYTLHRSLALASSLWFWISVASILISVPMVVYFGCPAPKWIPLSLSVPAAIVLINGFSGSYYYNWLLWGDSLISEVVMLKRSPPDAEV